MPNEDQTVPELSATQAAHNKEGMDRLHEEAAWEHYIHVGTPEYEQANAERIKDGKIKVVTVGSGDQSVTMVASLKVDPETNKAVSGHEYRPEAESMRDTETAFANYLAVTLPEQRFVIYEGDKRVFADRDEAIIKGADSGLIQHLAAQEQVDAVSAEPTEAEMVEAMERLGVNRQEILALYVARGLAVQAESSEADFLAGSINHYAASLGIEGFHGYTDAEKEAIAASDRLDEVKAELNQKAGKILPELNELYRPVLEGRDLLVVAEDGNVVINPEFADDIGDISLNKLGWSGEHRINEVAKLSIEMRDRVIFHCILQAYNNGKRPFVVYGGSHIVTLQPALEAYASQSQTNAAG